MALAFTLLACGSAADSELSQDKQLTLTTAVPRVTAVEPIYLWRPFGDTSRCIGFEPSRIIDHTFNPPRSSHTLHPKIWDCNASVGQAYMIRLTNWSNKKPYQGGSAYVQIKINGNLCLSHPANYASNIPDTGGLRWEICADLTNPQPEAYRQSWHIAPLANGATAISTRFQFMTSKPNPQEECIGKVDGFSPYLLRTTCVGRTMWMFERKN